MPNCNDHIFKKMTPPFDGYYMCINCAYIKGGSGASVDTRWKMVEFGNWEKMQEAWKNRQDPQTCKHNYEYFVPFIAGTQVFVEICIKCFDTKGVVFDIPRF